jgi:hypothetical protein
VLLIVEALKNQRKNKIKQLKRRDNMKFKELDGYIKNIDNGVELTDKELEDFQEFSITDYEGEQHRWTQDVESIIPYNKRLFRLTWSRGLTEMCESYYCDQPIEVEKVITTKTIEVIEYVPIKKEDSK